MGDGEWLIGRSGYANVRASHPDVSAKHAQLRVDRGRIYLRDLGSTNGTYVQGKRLTPHQEVELPTGVGVIHLGRLVQLVIGDASPVPALSGMLEADTLAATAILPEPAPEPLFDIDASSRTDTSIERARKRAMAEIEAIQAEAVRFAESLQEEARREVAVVRAKIAELKLESDQLRAECQDLGSEQETLRLAGDRARLEREEAERQRDELATERQALEAENQARDARNDELRREQARLASENQRLEAVQARVAEASAALATEKAAYLEFRSMAARERSVWDAEDRRRKALDSAFEAEIKSRHLAAEARLGEADLKRIETEREVQRALGLKQDAEREASGLRAEADRYGAEAQRRVDEIERRVAQAQENLTALEKDAQKVRERAEAFRREGEQRQAAMGEQETLVVALRRKTEELGQETRAAQAVHEATKARLAEEFAALRKAAQERLEQESTAQRRTLEKETLAQRTALEQEIAARRAAFEQEAATQRSTLEQEASTQRSTLEQEAATQRAALAQEFTDRGRAMERELADAKVKEMKAIQAMQEEERRAVRTRVEASFEEVIARTLALAKQKPLEQAEAELRAEIRGAMEGKNAASLSIEANERTRKFWKKIALRASVPIGIALFFAAFPGIPGAIKESFTRTVASEKNETGVFLDQIKQRGMKFVPETDANYRETYADNLLYLTGYAEMKLGESEQKEWTLLLNDFIVGRLGLSDRVIPDFISEESVMIRELMRIREGILPQFKEQGFARLGETEKTAREKLEGLLQGAENYVKFRAFEKSFYESWARKRGP